MNNRLKTVFALSLTVVVISIWIKNNVINQKKIVAIELISQVDFAVENKSELYNRKDTVLIYFINDLVIYREKYPYEMYNRKALHGDTVVLTDDPSTIDASETRYDYFVWKRGAKEGVKYSGDYSGAIVINVDSIEIEKMFKAAQFYNVTFDKLLKTIVSHDKKSFQEKYVNVIKPDKSYCDTTYYTFSSNFAHIPFSLSLIADSTKQAKLTEVRYVFNSIPNGIDKGTDLPKREMIFKIENVMLTELKSFMKVSEEFRIENKKLHLK